AELAGDVDREDVFVAAADVLVDGGELLGRGRLRGGNRATRVDALEEALGGHIHAVEEVFAAELNSQRHDYHIVLGWELGVKKMGGAISDDPDSGHRKLGQ